MTVFWTAVAVVTGAAVGALGLAAGLVVLATAVTRGFFTDPALVTPETFRAEQVQRRPPPTGHPEPDLAWPVYVRRQAGADLGRVRADAAATMLRLARLWISVFLREAHGSLRRWWLFLPLPALTLALLVATFLALAAGLLLLELVVRAGVVAGLLAGGLLAGAIRLAETGWRTLRGADASCTSCYHVSDRPAYRCPGCSALHRDLRPGVLGVLVRSCACGTRLPTTVLLATWRLPAVCQRCGAEQRRGTAAQRVVRIPVFGDVSAGKTRYLYAALDALLATAGPTLPIDFPDQESRVRGEQALELIRSGRDTVKTPEAQRQGLTCRIGTGATATTVHLFDAAGERFRDAAAHDELGFLATGHGLVYVIDPFAVGAVRDRLTGRAEAADALAQAAGQDPELAYGEVLSRLRGGGVPARSQRLAVVVSRADLLDRYGIDVPTDDAGIAAWLHDVGLHNLVLAARREFAEVRFFGVASKRFTRTTVHTDAGAPLRWLLRSRGVRLPERAEPLITGPAPVGTPGGGRP